MNKITEPYIDSDSISEIVFTIKENIVSHYNELILFTKEVIKIISKVLDKKNIQLISKAQKISPKIAKLISDTFTECELITIQIKTVMMQQDSDITLKEFKKEMEPGITNLINNWKEINPPDILQDTINSNIHKIIDIESPWLITHWKVLTNNGKNISEKDFQSEKEVIESFMIINARMIYTAYKLGYDAIINKRIINKEIENDLEFRKDIEIIKQLVIYAIKFFSVFGNNVVGWVLGNQEELNKDKQAIQSILGCIQLLVYKEGIKRAAEN